MIKRLSVLFILLVPCYAHAMPATVDYVVDGDTFAAVAHVDKNTDVNVRVRLINVDTPEMHGACEYEIKRANMARERLMQLAPRGSVVELKNIQDDKYAGRIDANVILPDGRDIGRVLINEKLGRPYSGGRRKSWCE
ncbi:MAG: thermonuclease family protein [Alphaproteobacteria bacterium]|nr:thermonuclease family protein [Alphaproteobacteria bacterium]